jgi:DNA-binding transcriptional ArsR family regulator
MTTLRLDNRSAYELLLTLIAYSTPQWVESYDVGPEWFARMDRAAGADLKERITRLVGGCEHLFVPLLNVAADLPPPGRADELIETLAALEPGEVKLTLLGYYSTRTRRRVAASLILDAARGSRAAGQELIDAAADGPGCERAIAGLLARSDEELSALVVGILRDWYESVFRDLFAAIRPILDRETERLRGRARELPLEAFLREAFNGMEVVQAPGIDEVALFPTWVFRPSNIIWEHGTSVLVGVAVPPEHLTIDPDDPPDRLVRLASALGDERRLRILRKLTTGSYSLHELSRHFGLPKTTLLHHLAILRAAGIVKNGGGSGTSGKYSLRAGTPTELHRLLDAYLPPGQARPAPAIFDSRDRGGSALRA